LQGLRCINSLLSKMTSQNITCNNLLIEGVLTFGDNTQQNTSQNNLAEKLLGVERNPIENTISFSLDNVIVNRSLQVSEQVGTPSVRLQNLTFLNDLDVTNNPVVQSKGFSESIRQNIVNARDQIDSMIPDIIDPPNKRIRLSGDGILLQATTEGVTATNEDTGQFVSFDPEQIRLVAGGIYINASNNEISSIDESTGLSAQFQSNQLLMNGNPPFTYGQLKADSLKMANDVTTEYGYFLANEIILDDVTNQKAIQLQIGANNTPPKLRIAYSGHEMSFQYNGIFCSGNENFSLTNNTNFFKLQSAISLKQTNKLDGEYIEKGEGLILAENVSQIRLYQCEFYLDDNQEPGWTTQIINKSGADLLVDYPDGKLWFSHSHGAPQNGPIIIKKWTTVQLILIFSQQDNDYLWTITQF